MGCNRALCVSALFVIFNLCCSSHSFNTITQTHFISDAENESLVSSDGNFKLGFFSLDKSQARYVGIWFNKISEHTVVWVANRGSPIKNSAGVFKIGGDGNLAIFYGIEDNSLWSTNVSVTTGTSTAKLLDSGNLVLVAENKIIWQSFDYPTNTILPGMKFGLNRNSGLNHILTSWKSIDDPTPGEYSIRFDTHGMPQVFLHKNSVPIWRVGPWIGRRLNGLPDIKVKGPKDYYPDLVDLVKHTYVSNDNELYVTTSLKNGAPFIIVVLEPTGTTKRLIWHESQRWIKMEVMPKSLCDEYARCGANAICNEDILARCTCLLGFEPLNPQGWYLPCVEARKQDGCGKGDREGFVRLEHVKLPDARNSTVYSNISLQECERKCLKSCNCTGYATVDGHESEQWCITWYNELRDMRDDEDGPDFYIRVDAVELEAWKVSRHILATKSRLAFIIFPVMVEIILAAVCFHYFWRRCAKGKKKQKHHDRLVLDLMGSSSKHKDSPNDSGESENIGLTLFELRIVISATNNFSLANKLGQGGFGPVYKTWELWRVGKALEIVDSCIADSCPTNEVLRCIHVGLLCVQDNIEDRPSMSNIVFMLSNETILSSPKKSTFAMGKNESRSSLIRRECSINKVTMTTFSAR